jgi:hypothetical protein
MIEEMSQRNRGAESTRVRDRPFGEIFYFCENFCYYWWGKFFILVTDSAPLQRKYMLVFRMLLFVLQILNTFVIDLQYSDAIEEITHLFKDKNTLEHSISLLVE